MNPYPNLQPRKWIYIAGPYSRPDPVENTRRAIEAADRVYGAGLFPVVPHLSMLHHLVSPRPVEFWYAFDLQWILRCDALLRLPGESTGADREVEFAREHGVRVFFDEVEMIRDLTA